MHVSSGRWPERSCYSNSALIRKTSCVNDIKANAATPCLRREVLVGDPPLRRPQQIMRFFNGLTKCELRHKSLWHAAESHSARAHEVRSAEAIAAAEKLGRESRRTAHARGRISSTRPCTHKDDGHRTCATSSSRWRSRVRSVSLQRRRYPPLGACKKCESYAAAGISKERHVLPSRLLSASPIRSK